MAGSKAPHNQAVLWKARQFHGVDLLKARFTTHVYRRHSHPQYVVGVIEKGVELFYWKGAVQEAPDLHIITLNPQEVHDGWAAEPSGFIYRVSYLSPEFVEDLLEGMDGAGGELPVFKEAVKGDRQAAVALIKALRLLELETHDRLEAQTCFIRVLREIFSRHAGRPSRNTQRGGGLSALVKRATEQIRDQASQNISLDDLAGEAGLSKFHFLRIFKENTGLSPHAYLVQRRVELARKAIDQGLTLAQAAQAAGFADQAHMTRRFKALYGVTPGIYRAGRH